MIFEAVPRRAPRALPLWAAAGAVGLVTLAIALATVSPYTVGAFQDDGTYVILGRAIATGAGYRYLHLPGTPAATHFPPGYPALLAALWRIAPQFPANVALLLRANAVLLSVSALLGVVLARRAKLSLPWACAVGLIGAASIPPLALAGMLLSESAFLMVLLAALLVVEKVARGAFPVSPDGTRTTEAGFGVACATGVLCGLVGLVRTIGVVLVPAAVVLCLARRRWRTAMGLLAGALVPLLPWQLWTLRHGGDLPTVMQGEYGSYAAWLGDPLRRHGSAFALAVARRNLSDLGELWALHLAPGLPMFVKWTAVLASLPLLGWGATGLARRAPVTAAFAALYLGVVLLWPFPPFRFVWAIWMLIVLTLVVAGVSIYESRPASRWARASRACGLVFAAGIGLLIIRYDIKGYRLRWWGTMQTSLSAHRAVALTWLVAHPQLPPITMSEIEPAIYLYTGRLGVPCNAFNADEYIYPRDTARDRAILDASLHQFTVGSVIATGPACALAALRLASASPPRLTAIDTATAGLAVFTRSRP